MSRLRLEQEGSWLGLSQEWERLGSDLVFPLKEKPEGNP